MIDRKLYKCDNCGGSTSLRSRIKSGEHNNKKVCSNCYNIILKPLGRSKSKMVRSHQKPKQVHQNNDKSCLNSYFEYHVNRIRKSDESNLGITATKVNCCHIFKKSIYKSVMCNLDNVVYLTWQEHSDFDKLLEQHNWSKLEKKFTNSWYETCRRSAKILPLILEKGKFKTLYEEYLTKNNFI